jgi:hypothetical protein
VAKPVRKKPDPAEARPGFWGQLHAEGGRKSGATAQSNFASASGRPGRFLLAAFGDGRNDHRGDLPIGRRQLRKRGFQAQDEVGRIQWPALFFGSCQKLFDRCTEQRWDLVRGKRWYGSISVGRACQTVTG